MTTNEVSVTDREARSIARLLSSGSINWQLLQTFLETVEVGSLRAAAENGVVSLNTIRTRIALLERKCEATLLLRSVQGVNPTVAGLKVVSVARAMREALQNARDGLDESS